MFNAVNNNNWNDGLHNGGRRSRLLVVQKDGEVTRFTGESIPGVLAITGEDYKRNGKWSSTTYRFKAAKGVRLVECLTPMHQEPFAHFGRWAEVRAAVEKAAGRSVNAASLEAVLRDAYTGRRGPNEGLAALDERQAALASLDDGDDGPADVVLSAFSPNMLPLFDVGMAAVRFFAIGVEEARTLADGAPSAVGHETTAAVFSSTLGLTVEFNRTTTTLQSGDVALLGQYRGPRLAEGATELPEGATIQWLRVEVE
jgi:hypothetical protein